MISHLQFLREQKPEFTTNLIRNRVLPLYAMSMCPPYLVASANWVLGELGSCLPEVRQLLLLSFSFLISLVQKHYFFKHALNILHLLDILIHSHKY